MTVHPVSIVMVEDDEGHARLIERNIRRAGVNNDILRFADVESEPVPRLLPPQQPQAELWHLAIHRSRPPRLTAEAPHSLEGVAALVACGRAVCFGSESLGQALLRPGLVVRPLSDVEPATLAIAWLRGGRSRRVDDFLAVARRVTDHDR